MPTMKAPVVCQFLRILMLKTAECFPLTWGHYIQRPDLVRQPVWHRTSKHGARVQDRYEVERQAGIRDTGRLAKVREVEYANVEPRT